MAFMLGVGVASRQEGGGFDAGGACEHVTQRTELVLTQVAS